MAWNSFATPLIGKAVRAASRLAHGGGSAFPGKIVERIDQQFLSRTLAQLPLGVVLVSGTNGKTTTTSLIYKIMRDAGMRVALGGNIGESFAYSVATGDYDWYVLELSSFQLDGMYKFRAHIGVLMNITPDHLDRYDHCFQNYADSKMRITQNQTSHDYFVYSGDDEVIWQQLPKYDLRMKQLPFAAKNAVASGAGDAFSNASDFPSIVAAMRTPRYSNVSRIFFQSGMKLGST